MPSIMPMLCSKLISPDSTNVTTMTDAADEEDSTIVTAHPVKQPTRRFPLNLRRVSRILSPATAFSPALIFSMPYRKSDRPPTSCPTTRAIFTPAIVHGGKQSAGRFRMVSWGTLPPASSEPPASLDCHHRPPEQVPGIRNCGCRILLASYLSRNLE